MDLDLSGRNAKPAQQRTLRPTFPSPGGSPRVTQGPCKNIKVRHAGRTWLISQLQPPVVRQAVRQRFKLLTGYRDGMGQKWSKPILIFGAFKALAVAPAGIVAVRDVQHEAVLRPWEQGLFGQPPRDRRGFTRTQNSFSGITWKNYMSRRLLPVLFLHSFLHDYS